MANQEFPFSSFNFIVSLTVKDAPSGLGLSDPLCKAEFAECDGLDMTMEPKTVREGGNNTQVIHLAGPVTYGNLTLKRGMTSNLDLWKWFNAAAGNWRVSHPVQRGLLGGAEIILLDAAQAPCLRYALYDCLPIKLKAAAMNAKDGIIAVEELQLAYSYFTVEVAKAG
jgi:phage tail-like protein